MSSIVENNFGHARSAAAPARAAPEPFDERMVCLVRFLLALAALIVIYIDPSEPDRLVGLTYAALAFYVLYSGALLLSVALSDKRLPAAVSTWADVGFYLFLVSLSSGTSSLFFYFFYFSILVASFRYGRASGFRVTLVSAVLFTAVGFAAAYGTPDFELNRFLLRPVSLLALGYMIAYWGGSEVTQRRRLAFLRDLMRASNPRLGAEQAVGDFMERVREFYGAGSCLLVSADEVTGEYELRRSDRFRPGRGARAEKASREIGARLLCPPHDAAFAVARRGRGRVDVRLRAGGCVAQGCAEDLVELLGDGPLITAPWPRRGGGGRLYVCSGPGPFSAGDIDFLSQATEQVTPVLENIELLDRLATSAAERERHKISRDIHDSIIQPYVGLKICIEAVRRKADPGNPVYGDVEALLGAAEAGLADLRRYVSGLRGGARGGDPAIESAVRQYAADFEALYGIEVSVEARPDLHLSDRLAAEAFQIVREALSNVRRHTPSARARVSLARGDGMLRVSVENDAAEGVVGPFTPRSIAERAESLGGAARVSMRAGVTSVAVEIPI